MRDQSIGKKGFFTLSRLYDWMNVLLTNLHPPLRRLEKVPVRVTSQSRR